MGVVRRVLVVLLAVNGGACASQPAAAPAGPRHQGLRSDQMSRVVMAKYGFVRVCYESSESRGRNGSVAIEFTVESDGRVSRAVEDVNHKLEEAFPERAPRVERLLDARVTNCIRRAFYTMRFPPSGKPTNGSWTFEFRGNRQ